MREIRSSFITRGGAKLIAILIAVVLTISVLPISTPSKAEAAGNPTLQEVVFSVDSAKRVASVQYGWDGYLDLPLIGKYLPIKQHLHLLEDGITHKNVILQTFCMYAGTDEPKATKTFTAPIAPFGLGSGIDPSMFAMAVGKTYYIQFWSTIVGPFRESNRVKYVIPPAAATGLKSLALADGGLNFSWNIPANDSGDTTNYYLEYKAVAPGAVWTKAGATFAQPFGAGATKFDTTVYGIAPGVYDFRLTANNIAPGNSGTVTYSPEQQISVGAVIGQLGGGAIIAGSGKNLSTYSVVGTLASKQWTGKAIKPSITFKNDNKKLKEKRDYLLSYKSNKNIGTATVTVHGQGEYSGSTSTTFKIVPKTASALKAKSTVKKQATVTWTKTAKAQKVTGYQLRYRIGNGDWTTDTIRASKSQQILNLKSGKTYKVQIRAYKTVKKVKYYSKWTASKKVKVK